MTITDMLGVAALILITPPLLAGTVALLFGDIIVAYVDSKIENKK